jgi:hypothetical protein
MSLGGFFNAKIAKDAKSAKKIKRWRCAQQGLLARSAFP